MPNILANIALYGWPLAAYLILKRSRTTATAVVLLFLIPYMWLPYGMRFDLPLLPPIDKWTLPALTAFFFLRSRDRSFKLLPESGYLKLVFFVAFISPFFTTLTNTDALVYGPTVRPALTFADIISSEFNSFALTYIPLVIGAHFLKDEKSHRELMTLIAVWAFIYSLLCLWEIKMSPQLHKEIYGFTTTSWRQQIRNGGFRPVVFMGHGLYVAMYMSIAAMCAMLLLKTKHSIMSKQGWIKLAYLFVILLLCKTWSAAIYAFIAFILIFFLPTKKWLTFSTFLCAIVFLYPMLRASDLIPVDAINSYFTNLNEDRGQSLGVRFENEDVLLEKARERPLFGWGGWGRQRVYSEYSGEDLTIADGSWIIIFGQTGWLGYFGVFGALCGAVALVSSRLKKLPIVPIHTAGLVVIVSLNLADLVPNSSLSPLTYLMAGALIGAISKQRDNTEIRSTSGALSRP